MPFETLTQPQPLSAPVLSNPDADAVVAALEESGAVILTNHGAEATVARARADLEAVRAQTPCGAGDFFGKRTRRRGAVLTLSEAVRELAIHPLMMEVSRRMLSAADTFRLSGAHLIDIGPGEPAQVLHTEDEMWGVPRGHFNCALNAMWALGPFTAENGATRLVPGSHHQTEIERFPHEDSVCQAIMDPGAVTLFVGGAVHGGGANTTTDQWRTGLCFSYALGWLRQTENHYLMYPPPVAAGFTPELRRLIGYDVHRPNIGTVAGASPERLFDNPEVVADPWRWAEPEAYADFLPEWAKEAVREFYASQGL